MRSQSLVPSILALSGDACTKKLRSLLVQRRVKRRLAQGVLAMRLGKVQAMGKDVSHLVSVGKW